MAVNFQEANQRYTDDNGNPVAGAEIEFFEPTTTTPRSVYSNEGLTIELDQPVEADAAGVWPQIYLQNGTYKYRITDPLGNVPVLTVDNVDPGLSTAAGALPVANGGTGATSAASARSNLGAASQVALDALDLRVDDVEAVLDLPLLAASDDQTYAGSFTAVFTAFETRDVTLTGNITFNAPTVTEGQRVRLYIIQDATGNRTATWNSAWHFPQGIVGLLSTSANAIDVLEGHVKGGEVHVTSFKRQDAKGGLLQTVYTKVATSATGTTTIPSDNTIPQNTEGTEFITVSITPRSTTSILHIEFVGFAAASAGVGVITALFQDSTAGALAVSQHTIGTGTWTATLALSHSMTSGTTSSTTFKIRIGGSSASTITFNGSGGSQLFGGVACSILKVTEIAG